MRLVRVCVVGNVRRLVTLRIASTGTSLDRRQAVAEKHDPTAAAAAAMVAEICGDALFFVWKERGRIVEGE